MVSRREFLQFGALGAMNYAFKDELESGAERLAPVPVTTFGQYGNIGSWGSLAFDKEGKQIYSPAEFVQSALDRHILSEIAFGKRLKMHIDLPTYHAGNGEGMVVFNESTGEIIDEYFLQTSMRRMDASLSINLMPPPTDTDENVNEALAKIFRGDMPGLSLETLSENIDNLNITLDLEDMVLREYYQTGGAVAPKYVSTDLIESVNENYVILYQSLQGRDKHVPRLGIYDFGTNTSDNMIHEGNESKASSLSDNIIITLDTIGTLADKAKSAENFSKLWNREVGMMFFLPASPMLRLGSGEAEEGIDPWDYEEIARWASLHSRGSMVMTH
jgi:hypothetical protein